MQLSVASEDNRRAAGDGCRVIDARIAALADRQHGAVAHTQLVELGLSRAQVENRRRRGWLRPLHRGVYAVGHLALTDAGRSLAAVLACGPDAVLSHTSAAHAWGLLRERSEAVHVTVVGHNCGVHGGIAIHRVGALHPVDIVVRQGIPMTSAARTQLDLASVLPRRELERAFDEGRIQGLLTPAALREVMKRYPRRHGAAGLRALIADRGPTTVTRSEAEERFLGLMRRGGLPAPRVNARIGPYTLDFYWPAARLAVEIDGYRFHSTRSAFERDHTKDLFLRTQRIDLLRFTWRQLTSQAEVTLVAVATALV